MFMFNNIRWRIDIPNNTVIKEKFLFESKKYLPDDVRKLT